MFEMAARFCLLFEKMAFTNLADSLG